MITLMCIAGYVLVMVTGHTISLLHILGLMAVSLLETWANMEEKRIGEVK